MRSILAALILFHGLAAGAPLSLHPENPHYFLFRGKPEVLVGSTEHYGAVINLDLDYVRYLDTLRRDKLNLTRTWAGPYRELPKTFSISGNTLAPREGRYIAPWADAGGGKYDLTRWNDAFFTRLKDFVAQASQRGIVVEVNLFCLYYEDALWQASPLYIKNNVNGVGDVRDRLAPTTSPDSRLSEVQDAFVRKVVTELRDFDNIYYEIANEAYDREVWKWQRHISQVITETEAGFPARHLISHNFQNGSVKIEEPDPRVSIFNFHYSRPPESVALNYELNRVIGNNEDGFDGTADAPYRIQAWDFLMAGGALYNHLDYSFTAGHEDGTAAIPEDQPGAGSAALRRQLSFLLDFMRSLDLVHMKPAPELAKAKEPGISVRALAGPAEYAIYMHHGKPVKDGKPQYVVASGPQTTHLSVDLPAGGYEAVWLDSKTGRTTKRERLRHAGGPAPLTSPAYEQDVALRIVRRSAPASAALETQLLRIDVLPAQTGALWSLAAKPSGKPHLISAPVFEIDGKAVSAMPARMTESVPPVQLANGASEHRFKGPLRADPSLLLEMAFRVAPDNPVVRFAYTLHSTGSHRLTKSAGRDSLVYTGFSLSGMPSAREVRLSDFMAQAHSYTLTERELASRDFEDALGFMGPILAATDGTHSFLAAYEHGSQTPNAFLRYELAPDRGVRLAAVKGNYVSGEPLDAQHSYQTVWLEAAAVDAGLNDLRDAYREFARKYLAISGGTRKPYIFYNTWNFQERNHHWYKHAYLDSMNQERILEEIDVAHRMGIDVFVLDTGWYEKTGDWAVSRKRFPEGLADIRKKLDGYGMKLGLWFSPTQAAVSSRMAKEHQDCFISWRGREITPEPVWETEPSHRMCLVSRYSEAFADELIRMNKELGVTYFKWDAIDQYACDDPRHQHGNASNTPEERSESYAFQLIRHMARVAERVSAAVPGAIVDFDVTESGRAVGLGFLSAGKYFLINNGPYYQNYDVPIDNEKDNWNLFFHKGPARTWICRTPLSFDEWIPSVLFMTHYLPDDPYESQIVNIGSLILGQNGIWGDLPKISDAGVALFGRMLGYYKQVREDITEAPPVRTGAVSGPREVHEKISPRTGRGAVVVFSTAPGHVSYVTERTAARNFRSTDGALVTFDSKGRARLELEFEKPGAHIVFFGAN